MTEFFVGEGGIVKTRVKAKLPNIRSRNERREPVRLLESYLHNFRVIPIATLSDRLEYRTSDTLSEFPETYKATEPGKDLNLIPSLPLSSYSA